MESPTHSTPFFDVMLLAEQDWGRSLIPSVPLLSRGWALLGTLAGARPNVPAPQPSHWTLFTEDALPSLEALLKQQAIA